MQIGNSGGGRKGRDIVARHGETVFNAAGRMQGDHAHTPLTRAGFAQADGFFAVPALQEAVPAGTEVEVRPIGAGSRPADLVVIGSQDVGLDMLVGRLEAEGFAVKSLAVGSQGGLAAAKRGECDLAGIHLMDPATGAYNAPFLTDALVLVPGYGRLQGVVFRRDDPRFAGLDSAEAAVRRSTMAARMRSLSPTSVASRSRRSGSRLEKGSSSSSRRGRGASARASATRCCWPPDSSCG